MSDDQRMIRDSAASFLADASSATAVRAASEQGGFDAKLWAGIAELGWCGVAIAEEFDGMGLGATELVLILEQLGRHLACAPYRSTVGGAASLLAHAGSREAQKELLPALAAGRLRAAVAFDAPGVKAGRNRGGWKLSGCVAALADAPSAQLLVFVTRAGVFAVREGAKGLRLRTLPTWDRTRARADVELRNAPAQRLDDPARKAGIARAGSLAQLALAAEQLGGAQQCLDLIVRYTGERKQFGRPIASFQAVKHRCAQMMVMVESLRSLVYGAAASGEAFDAAAARQLANEVYFHCAAEAVQLHGGVGFTWEFEPHLHLKKAQSLAPEWGSDSVSQAPDSKGPKSDFRNEVAAWMRAHLKGRFARLKHRGGPGDEEFEPALRKDWERELAAGGWTCVGWPKPWGRGLSIEQQVAFHEEYARAGGPGRISLLGEGLLGPALLSFGSEEQKQRHLPGIVKGTSYWAQGYSEPNAGSDLANVQTRCEAQPDGSWKLYGQKIWTSLAHESDWIFVLARAEPGSKGGRGLNFLLLPLAQPGITIRPIRQLTGGCEFNEVFFDGAIARAEDVVGGVGNGWKVAMGLLEAERGVSTLGQQLRFAHELALVEAAARDNGAAGNPRVQARLDRARIGLRVLRYNALRMLAGAESTALSREALIFKYAWSNWHRDLGKLAADVLGAAADVVSDDPAIRPLQQLFLFSRADTIYAGTNEIQLNLIAERGLGMPKEPRGDT